MKKNVKKNSVLMLVICILVFAGCNRTIEDEVFEVAETDTELSVTVSEGVIEVLDDSEHVEGNTGGNTMETEVTESSLGDCATEYIETEKEYVVPNKVISDTEVKSSEENDGSVENVNRIPVDIVVSSTEPGNVITEDTEWIDDWGEPDFEIEKGDSAPTTDGEGTGVQIEITPVP